MAITIEYPLDQIQLEDLQSQAYTTLKLYSSNSPEGPYTDTGLAPSPATLAAAELAGVPYIFTFAYPSGNGSMWFKVVATDGVATSSLNDAQAFHGGGGTNLQTIRQKVGRLTNTMLIGTTTTNGLADGSSAIVNNAKFRRYRDDHFGGVSGTDGWIFNDLTNDEWTIVSDWVQSTGTFSFSPALSNQVVSGTTFEVMARWSPDDYRDAINWAIVNAYPDLSKPVIDTNTLTEEDVFEYPIPNSIRILSYVEIESTTFSDSTDIRTRGMPWRKIPYEELDDGLSRKIALKIEADADRRLRFVGSSILSQLYNDTDYVEVTDPQVDLIVYLAAHRLYALLTNTDASSDTARFVEQAMYFKALYQEAKKGRRSRRKPKTIWGHDARWAVY